MSEKCENFSIFISTFFIWFRCAMKPIRNNELIWWISSGFLCRWYSAVCAHLEWGSERKKKSTVKYTMKNILNYLFTLTTAFEKVFVLLEASDVCWVIEFSSVLFIVVSQLWHHQGKHPHTGKKKWLRQANKMQLNLGFYWSRRRGTCIELLNKFTSFQFWLLVSFSLFFTPPQRCALIKSFLFDIYGFAPWWCYHI